ncbi:MAG: crossover junction endodeoxyribonuclease RuvC [Clostridia bacterium]|nr:crossover junction endodeoxyribonuclease RuvC [Clostridia bacterium]
MTVLGIDPGVATVGWGFVHYEANRFSAPQYGAIITPPKIPLERRLEMIYDELTKLIKELKPDCASIEELFFSKNITTGIAVSHARGVIMLACQKAGIPCYEFKPPQVKQAVVGYGNAEKKQVMTMTKMLLNLKEIPRPDDAADGLALAICCAHSLGMAGLNARLQNSPSPRR